MTRTLAARAALTFLLCVPVALPAAGQSAPSAEEILAASIAHHDPDGVWDSGSFRLEITGTRPLAGPTFTRVVIDNTAGRFHYERERWSQLIESTVTGDECYSRLDGSDELTEQQIERFGLSCEAMRRTRDYHTYLYGLPMKLRDPGTIIDPTVEMTTFEGREAWQIRVTYDPEVGSDTWYFYFSPEDHALIGYRFYHDEAANDGEYIVLDRTVEGGGIRIPKVRTWFTHGDDRLLGTDTVRSVERLDRDR